MTRIEAEWLVAWAIVSAKIRPLKFILNETKLNFGKDVLMKRCRTCRKEYYDICPDCLYRNGGGIQDEERDEKDLCEQMAALRSDPGYNLENALRWMRVTS